METKIFTAISETELNELINSRVEAAIKQNASTQPEPTEFLTRKEVSNLLGISLVTLWDWSKRGLIPTLRIGSRIRFKKVDVLEALNQVETLKHRRV